MRELDLKVLLVVVPGEETLAALPLSRVGRVPVNGSQAHLVEFPLLCHAFDVEMECLPGLDTFDAEVKPAIVVAALRVGQPIASHVASEGVS